MKINVKEIEVYGGTEMEIIKCKYFECKDGHGVCKNKKCNQLGGGCDYYDRLLTNRYLILFQLFPCKYFKIDLGSKKLYKSAIMEWNEEKQHCLKYYNYKDGIFCPSKYGTICGNIKNPSRKCVFNEEEK